MSARINQRERGKHTQTRKRTRIAIWTADCQKLYLFLFFLFPWLHAAAIFLTVKERPEVLVVSFHQPVDCRRQDFSLFHLRIEQGALQQPENKGRKKGKGGGNTEIQMSFFMSRLPGSFFLNSYYYFIFFQILSGRDLFTVHDCSHKQKVVHWVPWQIFETWVQGRKRREIKMEIPSWRMNDSTHARSHAKKNAFCLWNIWNQSFHFLASCPFKITAIVRFHYLGATPGDMDGKKPI